MEKQERLRCDRPSFFQSIVTGYLNFLLSGERIDMYESHYGNYVLFVISAFLGIIAFLIAV